jgi:hypothetical protein
VLERLKEIPMNVRRPAIALVFAASVAASIATSYAPAWHLEETVSGTALTLSPEAPKAAFLVRVIGNRATFSATSPPAWRLSLKGAMHGNAALGSPPSLVMTTDRATADTLGTAAEIPAGADGTLGYEVYLDSPAPICAADDVCERTVPLNFFLVKGGAVTGTFDVTVDIDGPDVPQSEAPKGATLKVKVDVVP